MVAWQPGGEKRRANNVKSETAAAIKYQSDVLLLPLKSHLHAFWSLQYRCALKVPYYTTNSLHRCSPTRTSLGCVRESIVYFSDCTAFRKPCKKAWFWKPTVCDVIQDTATVCLGLLRKVFNVPCTCSFSWKLTIFRLLHLSVVLGKNDVNVGIIWGL